LVDQGKTGVELALAGSIHPSPEARSRFHDLQALARGLDCTFYPNITRADLASLYERSAVLIHATGFGVDPEEFPEKLEHWGITPIEAASFGCIPVVYGRGGPKEVVEVLGCDTAFLTVDECADIVTDLLNDPSRSAKLSEHIRESSQAYSPESYRDAITESLRELGVF
jgi:glycosyltransferase involved in cell wall biosynthesis